MDSYLQDIKKELETENENYFQALDEQAKLSLISIRRWVRFFGILTIVCIGLSIVGGIVLLKVL